MRVLLLVSLSMILCACATTKTAVPKREIASTSGDSYLYVFDCSQPFAVKLKKTRTETTVTYDASQRVTFQLDQNAAYTNKKNFEENQRIILRSTNASERKDLEEVAALVKEAANSHYGDSEDQLCKVEKINLSALERANLKFDPTQLETDIEAIKTVDDAYERQFFIAKDAADVRTPILWEIVREAKRQYPKLF